MQVITIAQLEAAINAARQHSPARQSGQALPNDVNVLAEIYGELIYKGHRAFDLDSLNAAQQTALERWLRS